MSINPEAYLATFLRRLPGLVHSIPADGNADLTRVPDVIPKRHGKASN
jgi:hypothetical protein